MKDMVRLAIILMICTTLFGCPSAPVKEEETTAEQAQAEQPEAQNTAEEAVPAGATTGPEFTRDAINDQASQLADKVIYFDFDQSMIRPEYMELIHAHSRYLSLYPDVKVRLEGHTDERGTREYNVALGEARAKAVERLMQLNGVSTDQLEAISYGEEVPAVQGHNEDAWGKNRRVELIYETR